jgi:poly(beta-D-mannuronate) C5 epimerase
MRNQHQRFRLVLGLASVLCAVLATLSALGKAPWSPHAAPVVAWSSPTQYAERPDNPLPPRNRIRMAPDQFNPITVPKRLAGTPIGNIVLRRDRVDVMTGNTVQWSAPVRGGDTTLPALAALTARSPHPDWLKQTAPGVYQLAAGLVQSPGTHLEVVAPEVTELRMVSQPYVYMAGVGASALFRNVKVTSWLPARNGPDPNAYNHRPFLAYDAGGRLDIDRADLGYLGTDASKAYGVSWGQGTTGTAERSVFHNNLFGAYTGGAVGVTFTGNLFRDNARYGLDPHTDSSGLTITDNEAYGNNTHGIIFSKNVNHSVVQRNRSHDNGSNGIIMDERCDFDLVTDNESWNNRGDGIVIQGSSHDVVSNNRVHGNKVGVRVDANELGPADGTRVAGNQLDGNEHGIQVYGGAKDTVSESNQITDTADQAINFADPATSQSDTVTGAHKALVVQQAATVNGLTTEKVGRGVVVGANARAVVTSSHITGQDIAVEVKPGGHVTLAGTNETDPTVISGARKGIVDSGTADLVDVAVQDVSRGLLVDEQGHATITTSSIVTSNKGVEAQGFNGRGRLELVSSEIRAPVPLVGSTLWEQHGTTLSSIPSWLAVAGAVFVLLASLLHIGHRLFAPESQVRHRHTPARGPVVESAPQAQ